jgi:hypothetical protein
MTEPDTGSMCSPARTESSLLETALAPIGLAATAAGRLPTEHVYLKIGLACSRGTILLMCSKTLAVRANRAALTAMSSGIPGVPLGAGCRCAVALMMTRLVNSGFVLSRRRVAALAGFRAVEPGR